MNLLRIGVIGVLGRGSLARNWHNTADCRSEVVAGFDINRNYKDDFHKMYGDDKYFAESIKDLLAREDIDAVAVMSPDFTHEEYVLAAIKAGKHVFCEKPLAITTEGCDRILEAYNQSDVKMMVGFNMRYMNVFRTMKEIIDSGAIGEIKAVWVRHFVGFGGQFYYHDWHANSKNTTSLLLQKGSHDIDMIHWLTGCYTKKVAAFGGLDYFGGTKPNDLTCDECREKNTCVEYFSAPRRDKCCFRKEVDVEDNNVLIMELENGIKASYLQCHFTPDYQRNYTIIGTEGRIENVVEMEKIILKTRRSNTSRELADREYIVKSIDGGHGGADPVIAKDFIDMILDDKKPVATVEAGRMSVACCVSATYSLRNGGILVNIPDIKHT